MQRSKECSVVSLVMQVHWKRLFRRVSSSSMLRISWVLFFAMSHSFSIELNNVTSETSVMLVKTLLLCLKRSSREWQDPFLLLAKIFPLRAFVVQSATPSSSGHQVLQILRHLLLVGSYVVYWILSSSSTRSSRFLKSFHIDFSRPGSSGVIWAAPSTLTIARRYTTTNRWFYE